MNYTPSNLIDAVRYFSDLKVCNEYMRGIKWPGGEPCCHNCGSTSVYELSTRPVLKCRDCKKQFSYKVGIFEDSPLGLDKWFPAVWAIANCKNGISSHEDLAVLVNTGREISATFEYHERYVIPALAAVGVELHVIQKQRYATVDLTSKNGKTILIPAFTNQSGTVGKLPTFCSGEWKRDAISRWLRERGVKQCDMWMGYSLDEVRRVKKDRKKWLRKLYPLIDLRKDRAQCIAGVVDFGWPPPPRSRCWMCPQQCHREWKDLRDNQPDEFELACVFEETEIHPIDPNMFLHESCVPLRQVDFSVRTPSSFEPGCQSGLCFV